MVIPVWSRVDDDQAHRAMDLLIEADTVAGVREAVFMRRCPGERGICDYPHMTIRVLVVGDQAVVRAGFRVILGLATDVEVASWSCWLGLRSS